MAEIRLTPAELEQVDAVAIELEPTIGEFFSDLRQDLSEEHWQLLMTYTRACVRRALEVGVHLHALVDAQGACAVAYPGRGRQSFVRAGLAAWKDSFAPIPEVWRLCAVFDRVPDGEHRIMGEVGVLEVMAANRMFSSLDDQYSEFFASGS